VVYLYVVPALMILIRNPNPKTDLNPNPKPNQITPFKIQPPQETTYTYTTLESDLTKTYYKI
jgi:hypothetical protein